MHCLSILLERQECLDSKTKVHCCMYGIERFSVRIKRDSHGTIGVHHAMYSACQFLCVEEMESDKWIAILFATYTD